MSYKTTLIIAILLVLLGVYAYYFEYKGGQKKEEEKEKAKTLFEVKKEDVVEIRITGILPGPVKMVPAGKENWRLDTPLQARADQSTVDRILNSFEKLKYKEIIDEQPRDLRPYELDKPPMTIQLTLKGNIQREVSIGAKNPVDNVYYIKVNHDARVYLAEGTIGDLSTTTLLDLRDKKLTDFTTDKVESINLSTTALAMQFQKQNETWKMQQPVQSPASNSEVTSLLSSLESLRATRFIDQPGENLEPYGLKAPVATVELSLEKGLRQKIEFGKAGDEMYARLEGSQGIAAIDNTLSSTFEKKLEDWREKKVLVFNRFDAEEILIKAGGKDYSFKKGQSDKWNQNSPQKAEIEYEQIQGILEKLESAEITNYGDQPALDGPPLAEVFITLKDWQDKTSKKHLSFGAVKDKAQQVKNDDYGSIVFAQPSVMADLLKAVTELMPKPPAPPEQKKEE